MKSFLKLLSLSFFITVSLVFVISATPAKAAEASEVKKAVGMINAKLVTAKLDVASEGKRELFYEIPLDSLNISSQGQSANILKNKGEVSYKISLESNSVINVTIGSKEGIASSSSEEREVIIELKNEKGDIVKAKVKTDDSKVVSDKDGNAKLQIRIELPPEAIKSKGSYRATYYVVLQH